jgi:hypothetical protein
LARRALQWLLIDAKANRHQAVWHIRTICVQFLKDRLGGSWLIVSLQPFSLVATGNETPLPVQHEELHEQVHRSRTGKFARDPTGDRSVQKSSGHRSKPTADGLAIAL